MEFKGSPILITGAGSGFGLGAARRFARQGARIIAVDRNASRAEELIGSLENHCGEPHLKIIHDLRDPEAPKAIVEEALNSVKRIDVLVNSAGVCHFRAIQSVPVEEWDEVFDVDTRALFYMSVAVAEEMKKDGKGGRIIQLGSNAGRKGRAMSAHYAAAKAAVASLTESLALAYGPFGITVNTVSPAVVLTPMWKGNFEELCALTGKTEEQLVEGWKAATPLRRLGTVEDVVDLIEFLGGSRAGFITGQHINVCGGFMHTC
jgi:D-sorbitol dehydrogenase (acceptor)